MLYVCIFTLNGAPGHIKVVVDLLNTIDKNYLSTLMATDKISSDISFEN